jgi:hypothetical protein
VIEVEIKVVGMFDVEYLALAQKVSLEPGATVGDALERLHASGAIGQAVYAQVKKLRPPLFLVVNDEKVGAKGMSRRLADGDVISILQLSAGG